MYKQFFHFYVFTDLLDRAKARAVKGKKTPSAAAGSQAQLDKGSPPEDIEDGCNVIDVNIYGTLDEPLLIDSDVIPPTQNKAYKLSWVTGNIDTISVSSTLSEGNYYTYRLNLIIFSILSG